VRKRGKYLKDCRLRINDPYLSKIWTPNPSCPLSYSHFANWACILTMSFPWPQVVTNNQK